MGGKELSGYPGVLADDLIDMGQKLERPQRYVRQVADRRGDNVKPAGRLRRFTSRSGIARLGARRSG